MRLFLPVYFEQSAAQFSMLKQTIAQRRIFSHFPLPQPQTQWIVQKELLYITQSLTSMPLSWKIIVHVLNF